jgi:hypothetical protein
MEVHVETVRKRNISGIDLEVAVLDNQLVKADEEVDLPVYYPWHREPHGNPGDEDYDPGDSAPVGYQDTVWADVTSGKSVKSNKADTTNPPALQE